jgi:hypothetical protein
MTTKDIIKSKRKYRNYEFKDKKRDEDIIMVLRRHWLTFIIQFMPIIVGVVFIILVHFFTIEFMPEILVNGGENVLFFVESLMAMILWLITFVFWVDYYFDVWIITDRRIVDIEQLGLFRRNVSELEHSKVQDVTTEIHGILPTLLKYGFVYVQTAGKKTRFIFKQVPRPMMVRKMILNLQHKAVREKELTKKDM